MKRTHFALPEIYDDSLSYYDVLRKLIKSTHVISDNLNKIPEQIANEAKARLLGDQNLQQNINTEVSAREQADHEIREDVYDKISELKGELSEEKTQRETADNAINAALDSHGTRLNALESYTIGVDSEGYIGVTYNGE